MSMIESPAVILYDAAGVAHAVQNGVAIPASTPSLLVAGTDGTNARNLSTSTNGRLLPYQEQTFSAFAQAVTLGNNKSMLSLANVDATLKVKLQEVWVINVRTTNVTGVVASFEFRKFTTHSAGTLLTPIAYDSTDTLDADVSARTNATIAGEAAIITRRLWSSDEWGPGALDTEGLQVGFQQTSPFWKTADYQKPIILNQNEGIHVKCATNTTAGTFDLTFVFTQVP